MTEFEVRHHDQPMEWRGTEIGWRGEFELETYRYRCVECGVEVSLRLEKHVGPVPS